jgi:iron complex transport system substrate-binding protein
MYGDTWFLPGGKNNMSQLFSDAGLDYLWQNNSSNGFLELSFESVLERAAEADLWIGTANFRSLRELRGSDERYALFQAFQKGNVFTYDARKGPTGGSEYLELGYLRPDLILADLIHIGHPEQNTSHSLFFHAKLQE